MPPKKVAKKVETSEMKEQEQVQSLQKNEDDSAKNENSYYNDNICTTLGIYTSDAPLEGLTMDKCKVLFEQLQESYLRLAEAIGMLTHQRDYCIQKLTVVSNRFKELNSRDFLKKVS